MSVEDLNTIDIIGIDKEEDSVILTIADHLEWNGDDDHLYVLQEKINTYLGAIDSGELFEKYPDAKGRKVVINIVAKYEPDKEGFLFLEKVKEILSKTSYILQFSVLTAEQ
jgi:hypothetical protein